MTFTGQPVRDELIRDNRRRIFTAERALRKRLAENTSDRAQSLEAFIRFCTQTGRADQAIACYRVQSALLADPEVKADSLASIGEIAEMAKDYSAAIGYYAEALEMEPQGKTLQHCVNRGLGQCLVALERFTEAEPYCRKAVQVCPNWAPGHRTLGQALAGQSRWRESAACYAEGWRVCPQDRRSATWLVEIVFERPELEAEFGDMVRQVRETSTRIWEF